MSRRDFTTYKTHQQKSTYQKDNQKNQIKIVLKQSSVLDEQRVEGRLALDESQFFNFFVILFLNKALGERVGVLFFSPKGGCPPPP